ncbi:hypothetical protein [Tenacibaculum finnmarkense]|uniref:hypothetical protein n=1 Tax=Tenacibaculum finnmarkense TaxID=2781243 RepID=UPI001EFBA906|nr:hypothetical protein [Tenacibaculum finnmarkense]MCG8750594.1 hypothetical protein [Tenacibaculum finnmarkense]
MTEKDLIIKKIHEYHESNSIEEKSKLKAELLKISKQEKIALSFKTIVLAHFETFKLRGIKTDILTMLNFIQ